MIEIYCDGSSKGNGKEDSTAGFGVCVLVPDQSHKSGYRIEYDYKAQFVGATNNQMELRALLHALGLAVHKYEKQNVLIKSDSAYCVNMFNDWIYKWHINGWKRPDNKEIENLGIIKEIWEYCKIDYPNFRVDKIPGHCGILGNELADALAVNDEAKIKKIFKENEQFPIF